MTAPQALPLRYFDDVVETDLRVTSYAYGAGRIGIGVQITLEHDGVTQAVRLPTGDARDLAVAILSKIEPARLLPPDTDTRPEVEYAIRSTLPNGTVWTSEPYYRQEMAQSNAEADDFVVERRIFAGPWLPVPATPPVPSPEETPR